MHSKFERRHLLIPGAKTEIWILLDDGQIITLTRNFLWVFPVQEKIPYCAVVEFFEF